MPDAALVISLVLKALGSLSGAVMALVFQPPKTLAEFVTRAVFSILCGLLFGDIVRDHFAWLETWQMVMAAAALTSLLSWFIMGAATRIISKWTPPKE